MRHQALRIALWICALLACGLGSATAVPGAERAGNTPGAVNVKIGEGTPGPGAARMPVLVKVASSRFEMTASADGTRLVSTPIEVSFEGVEPFWRVVAVAVPGSDARKAGWTPSDLFVEVRASGDSPGAAASGPRSLGKPVVLAEAAENTPKRLQATLVFSVAAREDFEPGTYSGSVRLFIETPSRRAIRQSGPIPGPVLSWQCRCSGYTDIRVQNDMRFGSVEPLKEADCLDPVEVLVRTNQWGVSLEANLLGLKGTQTDGHIAPSSLKLGWGRTPAEARTAARRAAWGDCRVEIPTQRECGKGRSYYLAGCVKLGMETPPDDYTGRIRINIGSEGDRNDD